MFINKLFAYLTSKRCFTAKYSTYYFHIKMKILADVEICISVPLAIEGEIKLNKAVQVHIWFVEP